MKQKQLPLTKPADLEVVTKAWNQFQYQVTSLRPIENEADLERIAALANAIVAQVGDDATHPLYSLMMLLFGLIEAWETKHVKLPVLEPREMLRFLIQENQLKRSDLKGVASETSISRILGGRRKIGHRLARKFATYFNVSVDAFIG